MRKNYMDSQLLFHTPQLLYSDGNDSLLLVVMNGSKMCCSNFCVELWTILQNLKKCSISNEFLVKHSSIYLFTYWVTLMYDCVYMYLPILRYNKENIWFIQKMHLIFIFLVRRNDWFFFWVSIFCFDTATKSRKKTHRIKTKQVKDRIQRTFLNFNPASNYSL